MPMGDGSGPAGNGPRTGRGAGYCNGFDRPGSYNKAARGGFGGGGFGRGQGAGFGRGGAGFGHRGPGFGGYRGMGFPPMGIQRVSDSEYKNILAEEASYLEKRLEEIKALQNRENGDAE